MNMYKTYQTRYQDHTRDYVQIKLFLPQQVLIILYNSLILPHLQYWKKSCLNYYMQ